MRMEGAHIQKYRSPSHDSFSTYIIRFLVAPYMRERLWFLLLLPPTTDQRFYKKKKDTSLYIPPIMYNITMVIRS